MDHQVTGRLNPRPETNHTELVCEVDGHIAKQRVLVTPAGVTVFTRYLPPGHIAKQRVLQFWLLIRGEVRDLQYTGSL